MVINRKDLFKKVQNDVEDWVTECIQAWAEQYGEAIKLQYRAIVAANIITDCMKSAFEMVCEDETSHQTEIIRVVSMITWNRMTNATDRIVYSEAFSDWIDIMKEVYQVMYGYTLAACC